MCVFRRQDCKTNGLHSGLEDAGAHALKETAGIIPPVYIVQAWFQHTRDCGKIQVFLQIFGFCFSKHTCIEYFTE